MTVLECIGSVIMGLGVLLMALVTINVFRMDFAINRMHVTAIADTLGTLLIFIGGALSKGLHWVDLKLVLIITLQWFTVPVCGHMIAQMEYAVVGDLEEHCAPPAELQKEEEEQ